MPSTSSLPVVIAGMHRSGTSLVASYLASLGVHMGDRLLPADSRNPHGYFENADFVELHGRILRDCTAAGEAGHQDWGWTESGRLDRAPLARYAGEARSLVARRAGTPGVWGWKDPRTTLLLDFWDEILEERALYILPYRFPWEVADSMQRLGADVFLRNPEWAYPIWTFYNRHLLDFHRRHPDRSVLVSANALLREPARFTALLREKLGLAVGEGALESVRDRDLFVSLEPRDPLIPLVAATSPAAARMLAELDAEADLPATELWSAPPLDGGRWRPDRPGGPVDLSVVIPCYDQGELLVEAVASAERSAPERYELIIVNDGSRQPRTLEVLGVLRDAGYRVIDQPNAGLAAARNRGLREARGRCVLPLDADNRLVPGFPASALRILDERPDLGVVYGDRMDFGLRSGRFAVPGFDLGAFLWANTIDACAVYRWEIWEAGGGYDAGAAVWEDWELWISAAERGWRFHRLPEVAFEYRVRPGSMLDLAGQQQRWRTAFGHVYRKHRGFYGEHLMEVLLAAKDQVFAIDGDALALRASRDALQREADRITREIDLIAADAIALRASRDRLQRDIDALAAAEPWRVEQRDVEARAEAEREALRQDLERVAGERDALRISLAALQEELAVWRERVGFMEGTRAWRLRQALMGLKRRFFRPGAGPGTGSEH
jgi:glycosyltransferase involved in cell wall biosynthesis